MDTISQKTARFTSEEGPVEAEQWLGVALCICVIYWFCS